MKLELGGKLARRTLGRKSLGQPYSSEQVTESGAKSGWTGGTPSARFVPSAHAGA